jgi:hypothetical protein
MTHEQDIFGELRKILSEFVAEIDNRIDSLKQDINTRIQNNMSDIQEHKSLLKGQIQSLQTKIDELTRQNTHLEEHNVKLHNNIGDLSQELQVLRGEINILKSSGSTQSEPKITVEFDQDSTVVSAEAAPQSEQIHPSIVAEDNLNVAAPDHADVKPTVTTQADTATTQKVAKGKKSDTQRNKSANNASTMVATNSGSTVTPDTTPTVADSTGAGSNVQLKQYNDPIIQKISESKKYQDITNNRKDGIMKVFNDWPDYNDWPDEKKTALYVLLAIALITITVQTGKIKYTEKNITDFDVAIKPNFEKPFKDLLDTVYFAKTIVYKVYQSDDKKRQSFIDQLNSWASKPHTTQKSTTSTKGQGKKHS